MPRAKKLALLWSLIERVEAESHGALGAAIDSFGRALDALDDRTLQQAEAEFSTAMQRAHDWNLWGAAYVIHGGCGDDAFWDFRAGLIGLGREVYEAALADPDSLASVKDVADRTLFEGFQYVPGAKLEARGLASKGPGHHRKPPAGTRFDEKTVAARYPRLAKRFG